MLPYSLVRIIFLLKNDKKEANLLLLFAKGAVKIINLPEIVCLIISITNKILILLENTDILTSILKTSNNSFTIVLL